MTNLNQEALEKAQEAVKHMGTRVCTVEAAIRTYLASLPPVDAEPVGYITPKNLQELREGRIAGHVYPKGTLRPDNEVPLYLTARSVDAEPAGIAGTEGVMNEGLTVARQIAAEKCASVINVRIRCYLAEAEVARLTKAWEAKHNESVKDRTEARLWFEKAQEWKAELRDLIAKMVEMRRERDEARNERDRQYDKNVSLIADKARLEEQIETLESRNNG